MFKQRGVAIESTETPTQFQRRLQGYWPDQAPEIASYFQHLEQLRFAGLPSVKREGLLSHANKMLKELKKSCKRKSPANSQNNKQQQAV